MTTQVVIPQEKEQKFEVAAQEFLDSITKKHPGLVINQQLIDSLVAELQAIGMYREHLSQRAFSAAFHSAVASGSIQLPPVEPTLTPDAIEKLRAKFPVTIKYVPKELTQKEKNALVGVATQSGRLNHAKEVQEVNNQIASSYANERVSRDKIRLRSEYRKAVADAQMIMVGDGRSHAKNGAARKEALARIAADRRFDSVREPI